MISIKEAIRAIGDGKILIYPTDTVWGMGCDPFNQKAVDLLFKIKGKNKSGLSIILNNLKLIEQYCEVNELSRNIIQNFLPGPVTLILKSKVRFANGVMRNGNIAIRIPKHKTCLALSQEMPLISTSANKHGENIARNVKEAKNIFDSKCLYIEGEEPEGIESTIIDMTKEKPEIKRIGALYSSILEGIIES